MFFSEKVFYIDSRDKLIIENTLFPNALYLKQKNQENAGNGRAKRAEKFCGGNFTDSGKSTGITYI